MKKTYLIIILLIIANSVFAQEQWNWANGNTEGTNDDFLIDMKTDSEDNVYIAGVFYSPQITFGTYMLNNTVDDNSSSDIYLVKYNSAGEVLWAYSYGSEEEDEIKKIFIDNEDNIILVGSIYGTEITFDDITLTQIPETGRNMYVAKLDNDANAIWANNYGDSNDCGTSAVAVDTNNDIYLTGFFNGATLTLSNQIITNSSTAVNYEIFIAKLQANGTPIWAKNIQGADGQTEFAQNLTTDSQNNLIIHGDFWGAESTLTFNESIELTGNDAINYFIAKYDTNGDALWAKTGDSDDNTCETRGRASIITDNDDNIYAHIYFEGDNYNFGDYTLTSTCSGDDLNSFILKFDSDGNELWYEHFNGITKSNAGPSTWSAFAISPENELYVGGAFEGTELIIDDFTLINTSSAYTTFFIKYNQSGEAIWAETTNNNYHAGAVALETDTYGDLVVAGNHLIGSIFFDTYEVENNGGWDGFIAKKSGIPITPTNIQSINNNFSIYPNPTNGIFTITNPQATVAAERSRSTRPCSVSITDITGKTIYTSTVNSKSTIINLKNQPAGIYFIKIKTESGIYTEKLIIQ